MLIKQKETTKDLCDIWRWWVCWKTAWLSSESPTSLFNTCLWCTDVDIVGSFLTALEVCRTVFICLPYFTCSSNQICKLRL